MVPLYKPFMPELPELDAVLHSEALAAGEYTNRFENRLKSYFGTDKVIVTNSFHTAISVAITALGLSFGDEIIASPMACLASTQPYLSSGLKIIWSDVEAHTGTLDPDNLRKHITASTKCIVHNHFCGYPGYVDEVNEIGSQYGVPVIDDGIECFGSAYKERKIGNCGTDVTVFSFNPVRIPNTIDGGAVIFKDRFLYEKSILIRDCGIDRSKYRDGMGEIAPGCDIGIKGYSATMSNVNGYIGLRQMEHVDDRIGRQRKQAAAWDTALAGTPGLTPMACGEGLPNYWVYGVLAEDKYKTINEFRADGWYASGVHSDNSRYSAFGPRPDLLGTDEFSKRFVALPCGWWIG